MAEVLSADIHYFRSLLLVRGFRCVLFFLLIKSNKSLRLRRKSVVLSMVQINLTDNVPLFTYLTIEKEGFKTFPDVTLMTASDPIGLSPSTERYR